MHDYTLRDMPGDLHRAWKISAALRDISMKDYCFVALRIAISQDLRKEAGKQERSTKVDGHNKNIG